MVSYGGKFANGARTVAIQYLYNQVNIDALLKRISSSFQEDLVNKDGVGAELPGEDILDITAKEVEGLKNLAIGASVLVGGSGVQATRSVVGPALTDFAIKLRIAFDGVLISGSSGVTSAYGSYNVADFFVNRYGGYSQPTSIGGVIGLGSVAVPHTAPDNIEVRFINYVRGQ